MRGEGHLPLPLACRWIGARAAAAVVMWPPSPLIFVITRASQLTHLYRTEKNRGSERSENLLGRLYVLVPCQVCLVPKSTAPPTPHCLPGPAALAASRPVSTLQPSGHLFSYLPCGWVPPPPFPRVPDSPWSRSAPLHPRENPAQDICTGRSEVGG